MSTRSRSVSVGGWVVVVVAALPHLASAQLSPAQLSPAQQTLEPVTVTGSHVRRIAGESPTAVQIITAAEIERSGASTLNQVFLGLPAFSAFNAEADLLVAPERATLAYRNLGASHVLVLVNGRRLARRSVEANQQLVDLNAIPMTAVDRIEILKDGAGAIYGSDAMAGVVNIILKQGVEGGEFAVLLGGTSKHDGAERTVSATVGRGSLAEQGYNLTASGEYFRRSPVMRRDRRVTNRKAASQSSPSAVTGNYIVDFSTFALAGPVFPCRDALVTDALGTYCPAYPNDTASLVPPSERFNGVATARVRLGPRAEGHAELMASRTNTLNVLSGSPGVFGLLAPTGGLATADGAILAEGTPFAYVVRFDQAGVRHVASTSETARLTIGLEERFEDARFSVEAGHGRNSAASHARDFFDFTRAGNDANAGLFDPLTATTEQIAEYHIAGSTRTRTSLSFANLQGVVDVGMAAGGATTVAAGLGAYRETLEIRPDAISATGAVSGSGLPVNRLDPVGRDVSSVYAELSWPFANGLQSQFALRHDHYDDFGGVTTPKLALKWDVAPGLALRGSIGRGFVAPDLEQIHRDGVLAQIPIRDNPLCAEIGLPPDNCDYQVSTTLRASPNLKAETSRNLALGISAAPTPSVQMQLDWYRIERNNGVETLLQYMIDNPDAVLGGRPASTYFTRPAAGAPISSAEIPYFNAGRETSSGLELAYSVRLPASPAGRLTLSGQTSYVARYSRAVSPGDPEVDFLGTINRPRFRQLSSALWNAPAYDFSAHWRTLGAFHDASTPAAIAAGAKRVKPLHTLDWQLSLKDVGTKGARLTFGMNNATDREPARTDSDPNTGAGHPSTQSAVGRFIYLGYASPFSF